MKQKPWSFKVARLNLKPGDILIVQYDEFRVDNKEIEEATTILGALLKGVRVLFAPDKLSFKVLRVQKENA